MPGDKIEDGSIPLSALSEMPTASDVGAVQASLMAQITSPNTIAETIQGFYESGRNWGIFSVDKTCADSPFSASGYGCSIEFRHSGGDDFIVVANSKFFKVTYKRYYNGYHKSWFTDWFADLPTDGSVPMSGSLRLNGGKNAVNASDVYTELITSCDKGIRYLVLRNESHGVSALKDCLQVQNSDADGSNLKSYAIYGSHNKEMLTESVKSLPLADGFTEAYNCYYYKNADGDVVVRFHINTNESKTSGTQHTIATLPVGYRPGTFASTCGFVGAYSSPYACSITIGTTGGLAVASTVQWTFAAGTIVFKAANEEAV